MNQFRVECSEVNYFCVLVDAETKEEARKLARADINSFPVDNEFTGEWIIESIEEVWLWKLTESFVEKMFTLSKK